MRTRALIPAVILAAGLSQGARPEQAAFGRWRISGSTCPTECAMSRAAADSWKGRSALYDDSLARFAGNSCKNPRYEVGHWPATGMYGGTRLQDLGLRADSVLVIEVQCPAQQRTGSDPRWSVPGAFLIVKDRDHLLMVWEGTFFELTRGNSMGSDSIEFRRRPSSPDARSSSR